jgi:drug/metabolite transporter (DMT)-like permease
MSIATSDWIKGITFSVLASIIGGASKLAIRKSFLLEQEDSLEWSNVVEDQQESGSPKIRPNPKAVVLRISGMVGMTLLNPLFGVLAMNYASPSIVAPFSGLTLVWIVAFSEILIGESPTLHQIVAAAMIVVGEVIIAIYGDHTNDEGVTLEYLERSYLDPRFLAYLVGITLWMILLCYWINFSTSLSLRRFAWGVSGGSITGIQNFLKDTMTILKSNDNLPWYCPVFLMLAIAIALFGLLMLTACMKRYDVTYSSAMFVGSFVLSASAMSATHYNTFENLEDSINYILYPTGIFVLMFGVFILAYESKKDDEYNEEIMSDTDNMILRLHGLPGLTMETEKRMEPRFQDQFFIFTDAAIPNEKSVYMNETKH